MVAFQFSFLMELLPSCLCSTSNLSNFNNHLSAKLLINLIIPYLDLLSRLGHSEVTAIALLAPSNARHHLAAGPKCEEQEFLGGGTGAWQCSAGNFGGSDKLRLNSTIGKL